MKRKLSIVLLLAMFASLAVSCNSDGGDSEDTGTKRPTATTDPADNIPEDQRLDLDPDLYYDNDVFTILHYEGLMSGSNDENASARNKAKYLQIALTEDRLGVQIEYKDAPTYKDLPGMVTQSINTQTDDYQLVFGAASTMVSSVNAGFFTSINELEHVDFSKVWWNRDYAESISINENNGYVLFGDICYNMIDRTCAVAFNKELLLEHYGMTDSELYDIVLDGEWTIDKFAELSTGLYVDNGNNTNDIEDVHGISINGAQEFNYMAFSAGLTFTSRDEDGYAEIADAPTERMIQLADKLLPIFNSNSAFKNGSYEKNSYVTHFAEGKALFLPSRLFTISFNSVREMEDDYGIIPMPKLDETINGYHSAVGELVGWGLVPTTVVDIERTSAVAESLAYEGYMNVTPVYYENNLKLKMTRGDDVDTESQMIDLIRYGARTDFLYLNRLGSFGNMFVGCYDANSNNLVSTYASSYTAAQQQLAQIIDALEDN